jgi:glycine oxidase
VDVSIVGAGVAGLTCAVELAERGARVEVLERAAGLGASSCSWQAGGMLAPWCELAGAGHEIVADLGQESIAWWRERFPGTTCRGTLVVAHGRDQAELTTFARRTQQWEWADSERIAELEPALAGRFHKALYFPTEAHLDPRTALAFLVQRLRELGGCIRFGVGASAIASRDRQIIDCRGLEARHVLHDLRGVKGEMALVQTNEVSLTRPIRVLHPRIPLYIVPRESGTYMIGATTVESDDANQVTVRSVLELLSAAYALHPSFAQAHVLELGTGVRPAFPDNLPHIRRRDHVLYVNGLYRHGFLLAPALARRAAEAVLNGRIFTEVMDENPRERKLA